MAQRNPIRTVRLIVSISAIGFLFGCADGDAAHHNIKALNAGTSGITANDMAQQPCTHSPIIRHSNEEFTDVNARLVQAVPLEFQQKTLDMLGGNLFMELQNAGSLGLTSKADQGYKKYLVEACMFNVLPSRSEEKFRSRMKHSGVEVSYAERSKTLVVFQFALAARSVQPAPVTFVITYNKPIRVVEVIAIAAE